MRRRHGKVRQSPLEWGVRLALVAVVLVLAYVGIAFSMARLVYRSDPARGYALAPFDGRITATLAAKRIESGTSVADRRSAVNLARLALRQDPTAVFAFSTLGLDSEVRGDIPGAKKYFGGAQRLSRRNLPTQLWSIEDAVRRGDIPGALRQYDITLRVMPELWEVLFPVLAAASNNDDIRAALVPTLSAGSSWGPFFLEFLAKNSPDPRATTKLFTALQRAGHPPSAATQAGIVDKLVDIGLYDDAWAYYTTFRRGADRRQSRDPDFLANVRAASKFDWQPVETDGVVATLQDGILDVSVLANSGGAVVRQMQLLPPGTYRLDGRTNGIDPASDAQSYWVLTCQSGREIGRTPLLRPHDTSGRFEGMFTVSSECPVQTLTLIVRPSESTDRLAGQIDRARLTAVGR